MHNRIKKKECKELRTISETSGTTLMHQHQNYRGPRKRREKKKKHTEKIFEETIVEKFPNIGKEIDNQVQEAQRVPYRVNPRRNMPRHILIKLSKTE